MQAPVPGPNATVAFSDLPTLSVWVMSDVVNGDLYGSRDFPLCLHPTESVEGIYGAFCSNVTNLMRFNAECGLQVLSMSCAPCAPSSGDHRYRNHSKTHNHLAFRRLEQRTTRKD